MTSSNANETREGSREQPVKLSILMPVFNEQDTVRNAVEEVLSTDFPCDYELIVVDDGSSDETAEQLGEVVGADHTTVRRHPLNLGKGAALHTAAAVATGTHIVPFDADLEYEPGDLPRLLEPILGGRSEVVYGTRLFGSNTRYQSYKHAMGNRALTLAANVLFDAYISDLHTCLKVVPLEMFRDLELTENGFGLDTEITAKILDTGIRPFEVPVSYHSRSVESGKKITPLHGIECLKVLLRVRLQHSPLRDRQEAIRDPEVGQPSLPRTVRSLDRQRRARRRRNRDRDRQVA